MPRDWKKARPRHAPARRSCGHKYLNMTCLVCLMELEELRAARRANTERLRKEGA